MNCQEIQKFVHVYVDREFGDEERREFERHLQQCGECRAVVRFEENFKSALQSRIPKLKAPKELVERIRNRIEEEPEPASSWSTWLYVAVPSAAMAAAAMLVFVLWPNPQKAPDKAQALEAGVAHHERTLPMEVEGPDEQVVANWYRDKVKIPVSPPVFRRQGASLTGGRLVDFNRRPAAYLVYNRGDRKKVSVHIFDPRHLPKKGLVRRSIGGKSVYFGKINGHRMAVFQHSGVGYAITADVSLKELQRMVYSVLKRR